MTTPDLLVLERKALEWAASVLDDKKGTTNLDKGVAAIAIALFAHLKKS